MIPLKEHDLFDLYLNDSLTEDLQQQLLLLLRQDVDARKRMVDHISATGHMLSALENGRKQISPKESGRKEKINATDSAQVKKHLWVKHLAASIAIAACAVFAFLFALDTPVTGAELQINYQQEQAKPWAQYQKLQLTGDKPVEILLRSGTRLIAEGKGKLEFINEDEFRLIEGKLLVHVAKGDEGFTIHTSLGSFVDLGTVFAIEDSIVGSDCHVISGSVAVAVSEEVPAKVLNKNQALRLSHTGKTSKITYRGQAFRPSLKKPAEPQMKKGGWRYLIPKTISANWNQNNFDASSWLNGEAPFGTLKNQGNPATLFDHRPKVITTYYRRELIISPGWTMRNLQVDLAVDDGAVIYLNGVELKRFNLPKKGQITQNTLALKTRNGFKPIRDEVKLPAKNLRHGKNIIAIELHQFRLGSTDIYFDLQLKKD